MRCRRPASAAAAIDLFAEFSAQWKECDGTTLAVPTSAFGQRSIAASGLRIRVSRLNEYSLRRGFCTHTGVRPSGPCRRDA